MDLPDPHHLDTLLSSLGNALGSFFAAQVIMRRLRRVVDKANRERVRPLEQRIAALEAKLGWVKRSRDEEAQDPPETR